MDWKPVPKVYDALKAGSIDGTDDMPHDRGVIRAMNAKYKPNKEVVGIPEHTIFVGRLSQNTDEDSLGYVFSDYGEIKRLRLVRDVVTGFSRCYAFIEYFDEDCAYKAQREADKTILDEKEIYVDFECGRCLKGWIPRRLGGGIGGKKESGQLRFGGKNRPFKKPFHINTVVKPEGDTFRERLNVVERGDRSRQRNERSDRYTSSEDTRGRGNQKDSYRSRDKSRRSRSRDKSYRSRSRERRHNSRDRGYRSRSRESSRRH
ncbi:U11/U12 small nuclear ribonucleoprotein 35 kDa protein-like [Mercenaria mercenaria]|uniref:U11/U12 small nuclear ribonucleoprotein 35 kDa protein-like n=1 Tax=Mercenaria mercenaria TaxID=6596 RepID=UPI001E1DA5EC|nr:U11/U12 small nuclear ribonucleoprotein 35 kDa protein-like [Mercenaria mercenaria]XP_045216779.1 U11/U12 small nuclear ribonucleoprotein 35 kDa protein-like [Mercenaria mercenaria]